MELETVCTLHSGKLSWYVARHSGPLTGWLLCSPCQIPSLTFFQVFPTESLIFIKHQVPDLQKILRLCYDNIYDNIYVDIML